MGLQNPKPSIMFIISWMLLVYFVLLVISAASATLERAGDGGDVRAIEPPIVTKLRVFISTDGNKVPLEGVRL